MHIVLYQPEIPQNTGNIARLCAATQVELHLIEPFAFIWDDKRMKRAGLDYWHLVTVQRHLTFEAYREKYPNQRLFYATTKASKSYAEINFTPNDSIVFGPESRGLPDHILSLQPEHNIRIPMFREARSLNLSNSVAIILYEALRQLDFPGLD
ncbi:MAG TPA: tRNA (uridine(34)/cytosine(34)/5-carboxymethylaminomethyluridine(34)-2'-O)-methyltransferase TrmL [Bacillota bacterium]|nr:tRNA (uridine(34)/cytosine(34)/5-carboxymethylaminomethyluridine(34)-2'-O)-methyltransferase TrmL [Bacillota bacterium]HPT87660.1 tRNA (uridine(34)/cytosine(34)/5-carboxymethylaminomethyluridine(34)-2'-O)-methyltransferase TrmL [Bacillota bacterium]